MKRINRSDVELFHELNLYIPTRTIYMGSEDHDFEHGESGTDGAMAERTIKNLHILDQLNNEPITIIANNLGGDEYSCFAIIDAIVACKSHVTIIATGHAMSAGSLIFQAADERIMAPNATQMIHYGTWACNDHSKIFKKWAKEGDRIDKWMEKYYMERIREKLPDFTIKKLRNMLNFDTFLSAEESVALGLADKVQGSNE